MQCLKNDPDDLDAAFVFCWIAFNALYGQPAYLRKEEDKWSEWGDIRKFLNLMMKYGKRQMDIAMRRVSEDARKIQDNQFLCRECWVRWNEKKLLSKEQRLNEVCQEKFRDGPSDLFHRLYVLRNQIFHGCSSDRSAKNRESIAPAVSVLRILVPLFREIVRRYPHDESMKTLSFPPSVGEKPSPRKQEERV